MNTTDPISDMLTRLRNAVAVRQRQVALPYSKLKETVAKQLVDDGYLAGVKSDGQGKDKTLLVTINDENTSPKFSNIKRLSTPGRRLYSSTDEIPTVKGGRGMVVVSTSKGVMSGQQARDQKLGGELICEIY